MSNEFPAPDPNASPDAPLRATEPATLPDDEEPGEPGAKRLPGILWAVGGSLLCLLLLIIGGWYGRVTIANTLLPAIVREVSGVEITSRIIAIDLDGLTAEEISVRDGPSISFLRVDFSDDFLSPPYADFVAITGLSATISVSKEGDLTIAGLPLFGDRETTSGEEPVLALPVGGLEVRDIALTADTPLGQQLISGSVIMDLPASPVLFPAHMSVNLEDSASISAIIAEVTIDRSEIAGTGTVDLSLSHWLPYFVPDIQRATGRATLVFDIVGGGMADGLPTIQDPAPVLAALSASAEAAWSGVTLTGHEFDHATLSDGSATMRSEGGITELSLPTGFEFQLSALPPSLMTAIPAEFSAYLQGPVQASLTGVSGDPSIRLVPDRAYGWRGDMNMALSLSGGPLSLEVEPSSIVFDQELNPVSSSFRTLEAVLVRGLDLPRDISAEITTGEIDLPLTSILSDGTFPALRFPVAMRATVFGEIADPLWAERTDIDIAGRLSLGSDLSDIRVDFGSGSRISATGLTGTGDLRLSPNLGASVPRGTVTTVEFAPTDLSGNLFLSGALVLDPLEIALAQESANQRASNVRFSRQDVSFQYSENALTFALGPFDVEDTATGFALNSASLHLQTVDQTGNATLSAEALTMDGSAILPGSLSLQINGRHAPDGTLHFNGPVSFADGRLNAAISASLNPDAGSVGRFSINTAPVEFGPSALSLADFMPPEMLPAQPPDMTGTLSLSVNGAIGANLSGAALLSLDGLSVRTQQGTIDNLEGRIVFDIANFPATGQNQILTGVMSIPGLGRIPARADFQMMSDNTVGLNEFRLEALGGTISLIDMNIDPENLTGTGALQIRRVNMERLTRLAGISGVTATGRLSGVIPIRYLDGEVIVENGTVTSDGGGRLMIDNPSLAQALEGQGEMVQFVANILKDFHFDSLSAEIHLPDAANGRAEIGISGRNPDILDGHPVDLNVSLSTDHRALYDLISLVAALPTRLLRGLPEGRANAN